MSILCAIDIGHKRQSPGAANKTTGENEFGFNEVLAMKIEGLARKAIIQRVYRRTYETLPSDINELNPGFTISLHCNAYNGSASGTEVLYYHRSAEGKLLSTIVLKHITSALGLPNRGVKPRFADERGGYQLKYTVAPCVIAEPFFIDNDADLAIAKAKFGALAGAFATAIDEYAQTLNS